MHTLAFIGWQEALILGCFFLLMFGAKHLHRFVRGVTQAPVEFLKGRKENRVKPLKEDLEA